MTNVASTNYKKNNLGVQFSKGYDLENIIYVTQSCSTHNEKMVTKLMKLALGI